MHERAVVRNSLISGVWGQEERHGAMFPFIPGQGFELLILADAHQYKVDFFTLLVLTTSLFLIRVFLIRLL